MLCLTKGGVIGFPTDTVYGIGGLARPQVRRRLLALKKRGPDRPIGIFVSSDAEVKKIASRVSADAQRLMKKFWPGPLTLVFKSGNPGLKPPLHHGTIGIRIPNQRWLLLVLKRLKKPLLQTSANLAGQPPLRAALDLYGLFGDELDLIIEAGNLKTAQPSTVVDVSEDVPIILRPGALKKTRLESVLKKRIDVLRA